MSNGGDALGEGMVGKEPGRTLSLAVVVGDISALSLAPSRGELSAAKRRKSPVLLAGRRSAADRHRETHPVAEAVLKMWPLPSRRLMASLWHFRGGVSTAKRGSTLTFPPSRGCPALARAPDYTGLSEGVTLRAEGGDVSSTPSGMAPSPGDTLRSLLGSQVQPQRLPEMQNARAPTPQQTASRAP